MNVSEIMASLVQTVDKGKPLPKVAKIMQEYDIGCVVVAAEGRLDGLITDRDIVCRAVASGRPLEHMTAGDVMTPEPAWCREDDTVRQAAVMMEEKQVRRLPVLDFNDRLVGIVSMGDIVTHAPHELAGELIEEISRPERKELAETA